MSSESCLICSLKDILGKPGEGFHSYRIFNIAIFDMLGVFILGYVTCRLIDKLNTQNVIAWCTRWFFFGQILHACMCVETAFLSSVSMFTWLIILMANVEFSKMIVPLKSIVYLYFMIITILMRYQLIEYTFVVTVLTTCITYIYFMLHPLYTSNIYNVIDNDTVKPFYEFLLHIVEE